MIKQKKDLFGDFVYYLSSLNLSEDKLKEVNEYCAELKEKLLITEKLATVGQLGAGVAHEINNPLGIILMNVQAMAGRLKGGYFKQEELASCHKNIERIEEAAQRCKNIVDNLLTFSGKFKLEYSLISLNSLIEEVIEEVCELREHFFFDRGIEFIREYGNDMPSFMGDARKIKQVFLNLFLNSLEAFKISDNKNNWIKIKTFFADEQIRTFVSDSGCGIPDENLIKLFDPFFTTKVQGTGLGLAVSYGIIDAHDGLIEVESQEGEGSTFTIIFPAPSLKAKNN